MTFLSFTLSGMLLLAPALSFAGLKPSVAERLEAFTAQSDGTQVTEEYLRRGDHPGTALQASIKRVAARAMAALDASVRNAPFNDVHMGIDGPICYDAAPKFGVLLRAAGIPAFVAASSHHVFLIAQTPAATLLIDPTIHQYFGQDAAPDWVPRIFVGTLSEVKALYERDPGMPVLPYKEVYFNPEDPSAASDGKMIHQRSRLVSSPDGAEYAPLTKYLNAADTSASGK